MYSILLKRLYTCTDADKRGCLKQDPMLLQFNHRWFSLAILQTAENPYITELDEFQQYLQDNMNRAEQISKSNESIIELLILEPSGESIYVSQVVKEQSLRNRKRKKQHLQSF